MNMVLRGEGRLTTQRELWQTPRGEHLTFGQETGVCSLAALLRFMEAGLIPLSTCREPNAGRQVRLQRERSGGFWASARVPSSVRGVDEHSCVVTAPLPTPSRPPGGTRRNPNRW